MVARNIAYTVANSIVSLVHGAVFTSVIVARATTVDQFGEYSYAMSVAVIGTAIASLGVDSIAIKSASADLQHADTYYRFSFVLKSLAGVVVLALVVAASFISDVHSSAAGGLLLVSGFIPLVSAWSTYETRLVAELQASRVLIVRRVDGDRTDGIRCLR